MLVLLLQIQNLFMFHIKLSLMLDCNSCFFFGYNTSLCLSLLGMCTTAVGTIELKQLFPAQRQNNCSDFNSFWQAEAGRNRESLCWVCTTLAGGFKAPKPIAEHAWMACIFPSNYNHIQPSVSPIITQTQAVRPTQEDKTVTWQRCLKCDSCLMTVREHSKYSAELNILWNMAWWTPSHCSQTVRVIFFSKSHEHRSCQTAKEL